MKNKENMAFAGSSRRTWLKISAASALAAACGPMPVLAQSNYPERPVRIVVPSSPGGSLDAVARIIGQQLAEYWKTSVYIENKAGANLIIGTSYAAKAPADGYTLLFAHDGAMAINPVIYRKLQYGQNDFLPVAQVAVLPMVLYVNSEYPARNFDQLMRALRAQPGKLSLAVGGTSSQLTSELFKSLAKVDYENISYKGAGPGLVALAAGEVQLSFADTGSAASMMQTGKIRPIAVAAPERVKQMPDVPLISEIVPGYSVTSWSGLFAPAGTPPAVVEKIAADVRAVMAAGEARSRLETLGVIPATSTPQKFGELIAADTANWRELVKARNLYQNE
ncbi:Tripartite tricarboxylate transporter family receptor [Pigmentiphaga humi]|uniref:Tripartite tricarboxylate transporter family receptor n=1 Tax=Pigmentiphaga humi TaxID=2478468 RepID=A0A3P4B349_9BURK|nr:tripartite tricarboxylate transporter substrate binding protein [Pigmentiphaga humi]VCU70719.1 Tripartite tricarboxylate transporter family receptor [Pigmentiphaga humi]